MIKSLICAGFAIGAAMTLSVDLGPSLAYGTLLEEVQSDSGSVLAAASNGMTLYTFRNDVLGLSTCYDDCATNWPPFVAGPDARPEGEFGIVERDDGLRQWTLRGMPLYFWQGDWVKGDAKGDRLFDAWFVARP